MPRLSRRALLKMAGASALTAAVPAHIDAAPAAAPAARPTTYLFFTPQEAAFIQAAVARLIPADDLGPGALEAGVPQFMDLQLGGAWGAGERLYRSGPWQQGTPSQGYQMPFTPAELFRKAIRAINNEADMNGGLPFHERDGDAQDAYLTALQNGEKDLDGIPSAVFFESLLAMTIEGFFCDPVYGGNRDMAAWRMIGFPGAYADYYHLVDQYGIALKREPISLAQDGRGKIKLNPDIPAHVHGRGR